MSNRKLGFALLTIALSLVALSFVTTVHAQFSIYDVNKDGKVDIFDIAAAVKAFGTSLGDSRYNPDADVNDDGRINIFDIALIAANFG